jgi:hypothetical protein
MTSTKIVLFPTGGAKPFEEAPPAPGVHGSPGNNFAATRGLTNDHDLRAFIAAEDGRGLDFVAILQTKTAGQHLLLELL